MKVAEKQRDVTISGDFVTQNFGLEITPQVFHHVSSTVYNDKVSAVLREYHNNGWDAHVEAGHRQPVKVQIPTSLDPRLVIRDFGTGLSEEQCFTVFAIYFKSTKQHTDDLNGAIGIGAKSGFSLSESFNVTSFYNGKKLMFKAFKNDKGYPELAKLMEVDTDEPNGVEISLTVPSDKIYNFVSKAVNIYKITDVTPDINLRAVRGGVAEFKERSHYHGDIILDPNDSGLQVIMSNVAYRYNNRPGHKVKALCNKFGVYVHIPNGSGEFNLGREDIVHSKEIDELVEDAIESAIPAILKELRTEVDACVYEQDARKLIFGDIYGAMFSGEVKYKGEQLRKTWGLDVKDFVDCYKASYNGVCRKHQKESDDGTEFFSTTVQLSDVFFSEPQEKELAKIKQFVRDNKKNAIILTRTQAIRSGINPDDIQDPADLPDPPVRCNRGYNSNPTIQCYKISDGKYVDFEGRLPNGSVYATIFRKEVKCNGVGWNNSLREMSYMVKSVNEELGIDEDVYIIRKSVADRKWFKNSGCVQIDDFYKDQFKDRKGVKFEKSYGYKGYEQLIDVLPDDEEVKTLNKENSSRYVKYYGKPENITTVNAQQIEKTLDNRYPILDMLDVSLALNNPELLKKALKLC